MKLWCRQFYKYWKWYYDRTNYHIYHSELSTTFQNEDISILGISTEQVIYYKEPEPEPEPEPEAYQFKDLVSLANIVSNKKDISFKYNIDYNTDNVLSGTDLVSIVNIEGIPEPEPESQNMIVTSGIHFIENYKSVVEFTIVVVEDIEYTVTISISVEPNTNREPIDLNNTELTIFNKSKRGIEYHPNIKYIENNYVYFDILSTEMSLTDINNDNVLRFQYDGPWIEKQYINILSCLK